jgi:hypothetical protein
MPTPQPSAQPDRAGDVVAGDRVVVPEDDDVVAVADDAVHAHPIGIRVVQEDPDEHVPRDRVALDDLALVALLERHQDPDLTVAGDPVVPDDVVAVAAEEDPDPEATVVQDHVVLDDFAVRAADVDPAAVVVCREVVQAAVGHAGRVRARGEAVEELLQRAVLDRQAAVAAGVVDAGDPERRAVACG